MNVALNQDGLLPSEGGGKGNVKQRLGEEKKKEGELLVFQKEKRLAGFALFRKAAFTKNPSWTEPFQFVKTTEKL